MRSFQLSVRSKIESGRCSNGPLAGLLVHLLMNEGNDLPTSLARATLLRGLIRNPQGYTMYCSEAVLRRIYYPSQVESICKTHYVIDYPGLVVLCKKVFENQIHLERFQKNGISFDPINDLDLTNQFLMWNEKGVRGKPGMHQRLKVRWQNQKPWTGVKGLLHVKQNLDATPQTLPHVYLFCDLCAELSSCGSVNRRLKDHP